jgi:hypothetical protein
MVRPGVLHLLEHAQFQGLRGLVELQLEKIGTRQPVLQQPSSQVHTGGVQMSRGPESLTREGPLMLHRDREVILKPCELHHVQMNDLNFIIHILA